MKKLIYTGIFAVLTASLLSAAVVNPGDDLQAVLDRGEDLELKQSAVYNIMETLRYKKQGQKIYTKDARFPSEYATLKIADKGLMMLVNAGGVKGAMLEHVTLDGNRYALSVVKTCRTQEGIPQQVTVCIEFGDKSIKVTSVLLYWRTP